MSRSTDLKTVAKRALAGVGLRISRVRDERVVQNRHHWDEARKALAGVESIKGPTDPRLLAEADTYAEKVLGWKGYAPWLHVYAAVSGDFREGWMPDNYYGTFVVGRLKGRYGAVSGLKSLAGKMINSEHFPDIAYQINGGLFSRGYEEVAHERLKAILFRDTDRVVFKSDGSGRGRHIYFFDEDTFDFDKVAALGNGVFQKCIDQHPEYAELGPSAVATLRLTSVIEKDTRSLVRAAFLRVGQGTDTHVISGYHLRLAVDPRSAPTDTSPIGAPSLTTPIPRCASREGSRPSSRHASRQCRNFTEEFPLFARSAGT
jgi:hypothetical protein